MHNQDRRAHRNTIPAINIAIIRLKQKGADNRKEDNHHQDRNDGLIGGEDASTGRAGT